MSHADVVKLVYTPDLGSGALRREGSSPFIRTIYPLYWELQRLSINKLLNKISYDVTCVNLTDLTSQIMT